LTEVICKGKGREGKGFQPFYLSSKKPQLLAHVISTITYLTLIKLKKKRPPFFFQHHKIVNNEPQVSLSYKDASLGNPVQIAVVQMLLLKDQEFILTTATGDDSASISKE
jgi:hypothetical protein